MHRSHILDLLKNYRSIYPEEKKVTTQFEKFIHETPDCFERFHKPGHVTGSAFVLSPDRSSVLLGLHGKLNQWFQLGGHADGCFRVDEVAFREAVEEGGIESLRFHSNSIPLDLDIHEIPKHKEVEPHLHYDVRFLLLAEQDTFSCSDESFELKWVRLEAVSLYSKEISLLRCIDKIRGEVCRQPLFE